MAAKGEDFLIGEHAGGLLCCRVNAVDDFLSGGDAAVLEPVENV